VIGTKDMKILKETGLKVFFAVAVAGAGVMAVIIGFGMAIALGLEEILKRIF